MQFGILLRFHLKVKIIWLKQIVSLLLLLEKISSTSVFEKLTAFGVEEKSYAGIYELDSNSCSKGSFFTYLTPHDSTHDSQKKCCHSFSQKLRKR